MKEKVAAVLLLIVRGIKGPITHAILSYKRKYLPDLFLMASLLILWVHKRRPKFGQKNVIGFGRNTYGIYLADVN